MPDVWLPHLTRVDLGLAGGPYDETWHPKALWHTTEGDSVSGARRAFAPYPPHLCYDPRSRYGEQYVPLNRHSYSLRGSESDDEYCIQVELVGYAGQAHTWPDDWLRNIAVDLVRPLRELLGVPDVVVWHGFRRADEGIVLASTRSPIRLSDTQLRAFSGHLGHQHAPPPDEHWDPGGLPIARILTSQEDDVNLTDQIPQRNLADGRGGYTRAESTSVANALGSTHAALFYDNQYGPALVSTVGQLARDLAAVKSAVEELRSRPPADVDEAALAAELEQRGIAGATKDDVMDAIRQAFARAGASPSEA